MTGYRVAAHACALVTVVLLAGAVHAATVHPLLAIPVLSGAACTATLTAGCHTAARRAQQAEHRYARMVNRPLNPREIAALRARFDSGDLPRRSIRPRTKETP